MTYTTWMGTDISHGRRCFKCWKTASSGNPPKRIPTRGLRILWKLPWKKWYYYVSDSEHVEYFTIVKSKIYVPLFFQDYDHDGRVSYSDFEKTVVDETLLLEAFGNCLPDTKVEITTVFACKMYCNFKKTVLKCFYLFGREYCYLSNMHSRSRMNIEKNHWILFI